MAMIAIPISWAQTNSSDTQPQPSNPIVEQPEGSTQPPTQNPQMAPSQTPPQSSNPVAEQPEESAPAPVQQPAQNSQMAPSQTPPQPSNPVAEQPEESAPAPVQQPAQNSQAAPSQTPPQPSNPVAEQPEESAPKSGKQAIAAEKRDKHKPLSASATANPVLWKVPDNIAAKNLFWGQGGERQPKPPFVFIREDRNGTSPKCDVRDATGEKWRVKLGAESRPEVVASRLLWAVGYFANDDYVLPEAHISGLKMKRKSDKMHGTQVFDARFARKPDGEKKIGIWKWSDNPFVGTRAFNGLRVMMAVMNNWDLKDSNNAVYADRKNGTQIFLASDIGATFGANRYGFSEYHAKGNLDSYEGSKFITHVSATEVDFGTPSPPLNPLAMAAGFGEIMYAAGMPLEWIGKHIPIEDARWIGSMLGQLSHQQLEDAFRAGNFQADEADAYVKVLEDRIAELKGL
ncbi:MAG: hypothetical protein WA532_00180 [Candidatus Korobacteraceae bacterium]